MLCDGEQCDKGHLGGTEGTTTIFLLPGEHIPSASSALCLQITSPVLASLLGPKKRTGKKSISSSTLENYEKKSKIRYS